MARILCVSDEIDPLVYSNNLKKRYGDVDFVIGAGDLDLSYYGFIVSTLNRPLYFIFGNHHLSHLQYFSRRYRSQLPFPEAESLTRNFFGSTYIGEGVKRDKRTGLILAGFGGSHRYNKGNHQFTDLQMWVRVLLRIPKMVYYRLRFKRWIDIMVTHAPPFGINDREDRCHQGFKAFLWFMRVFKPRYLLHGHVHLLDSNEIKTARYQDTEIINVFHSYLLEVEENHGS
jgi:hypothetical protein